MQQRQFTSGSRQAPDPYDQFLEEQQYYRKHTARDASCLFRVLSEQCYDTQMHHLTIRAKCVTYMRKHRKFFHHLVDRDFDEYLDDMSKPKTYGTLLELQAASYLFERNVILFEPFDLGNYFSEYRSYFKEVFRVFYTPERHFDSVFTSEYIQEAAICQSICYEILYKDLFKLPDVSFAVEQMLHGPNYENLEYNAETNEDGYATRLHLNDGRTFELDSPHTTNCILEDRKLCHFHYSNFPRFSDDLQRELKTAYQHQHEETEKNTLLRTAESFLPNKYMSCVRQLLQEGITPFPYKVAKALDPNMYRNIEFDSWNEMRKELKLQNWYNGDANFKLIRYWHTKRVRKIFQVGAKCHVKLRKSEQDLYTCHIQEMAVDKGQCIVYIEQLGEKRLVPYENLTPLPADQFKPWTVPYRFQRHMHRFSSMRFTRHYNYRFKTMEHHHHHHVHQQICENEGCSKSDFINEDDPKRLHRCSYYKLNQYTHLEDFRTQYVYCTMPVSVKHNGGIEKGTSDETVKDSNVQQQESESNDNSRTTSRSTHTMTVQHPEALHQEKANDTTGLNANEDHGVEVTPTLGYALQPGEPVGYELYPYNGNGGAYLTDMQNVYPVYLGGNPDEYYPYYGYEPTIVPSNAGFVSAGYIVPPGSYMGPSPNQFFATAPQHIPIAAVPPIYAQTPQYTSSAGATNFAAGVPYSGALPSSSNPPNSSQNAMSPRQNRAVGNSHNMSNTPVSRLINYDAKKSFKANGSDLPDLATLRFFYNMGVDSYHRQFQLKSSEKNEQAKAIEAASNDETERLSVDLQNIHLDENDNQIVTVAKSDANNNTLPDAVSAANGDKPSSTQNIGNKNLQMANNPNAGVGGNKTNHRRYNSRYFTGRDRQMHHQPQQQRNYAHSNSSHHASYNNHHQHQQNASHHQQHQQQHSNHTSRFQGNNSNPKSGSYGPGGGNNGPSATTPNSSRNYQTHLGPPSSFSSHQQQNQAQPHSSMTEQCVRTPPVSGYGGYDEPFAAASDSHNCNTPTSNNSNGNQALIYGGESIMCAGAPFGVTVAPSPGSGIMPMPMTPASGPPPSYGFYAPHGLQAPQPPPQGYSTHNAGGHQNYVPMHLTPMPSIAPSHGGPNSTPSGSDTTETNADMANNGFVNSLLPFPTYPPPPLPSYYYNGVAPPNGNGGPPVGNGGVQLVTQMGPPTPTNPYQNPHLPMGTQGFSCLPPSHSQHMPPPLPPPRMLQAQQSSPMTGRPDMQPPPTHE